MAGDTAARLAALGITLPSPSAPAANYVPWTRVGDLVFVSGQIPLVDGKPAHVGKVGVDLDIARAYEAARLCALSLLAHANAAAGGDLDRVRRCVKLLGFVNASPEFGDHPKVVNGASDLIVAVLGDRGRHARSAVGAGSLPFGVSVEVEAIFDIA
jgi:enamine deaminase RidA (YjgF/YER057c/UK114 family)